MILSDLITYNKNARWISERESGVFIREEIAKFIMFKVGGDVDS